MRVCVPDQLCYLLSTMHKALNFLPMSRQSLVWSGELSLSALHNSFTSLEFPRAQNCSSIMIPNLQIAHATSRDSEMRLKASQAGGNSLKTVHNSMVLNEGAGPFVRMIRLHSSESTGTFWFRPSSRFSRIQREGTFKRE